MGDVIERNARMGCGGLADVALARDIEAEFRIRLPVKAYDRSWRLDDPAEFLERRSRRRPRNPTDVERGRSKASGQVRRAVFWAITGPAFSLAALSFAWSAAAFVWLRLLCLPFLAVAGLCRRSLPHHRAERAHHDRIAGSLAGDA
jgi:hypothetical protein